jgi:hypothetical protein
VFFLLLALFSIWNLDMEFMGPKKNPKTYNKISNYPKVCNKNSFNGYF